MKQLRVGLALDGLLTDTQGAFEQWKIRQSVEADSFLNPKFIRNESFWMSLKTYPDIRRGLELLNVSPVAAYVLTERPQSLIHITAAWLRFAGLEGTTAAHIVPQTIKRYDCRLLGLSVLLDSDLEVLRSFVYDETEPVYVDRERKGGIIGGRIKNENRFDEAIEHVIDSLH